MIFVTAGHVDHGKTALLQALTGTHTAHLPEEKKRGLTIDLGYAYLPITDDAGSDHILGFIDVPGHQKFLSNMLAGLGGINHALLIVSAEEGIKPQTEEHLTLLRLLGFEQIVVVITKSDRSTPDAIFALIEQLKRQYPFLQSSPFFTTSAVTRAGIDELQTYLIGCLTENPKREQPFRYAIDRVFNIKGAGTVVTGTAVAGRVQVGEELFLSNGKRVRVKGIHAQNQPSEMGEAGQRLALNLANVETAEIVRGDWLTALSPDFATDRITVKLHANQPMKENTVVHFYHFASHITGKVNLLDSKQAVEKGENLAEIILDEPLHIAFGDKVILRSGDDSHTLAGASVIEIHSPKRHKRSETRLAYLREIAEANGVAERIALYVQNRAVALEHLLWVEQQYRYQLAQFGFDAESKWVFSNEYKRRIQQAILAKLAEYHANHTDQLGVSKARLYRISALFEPEALVYEFIDELVEAEELAQTRGWLHLPDHCIEFSATELQIWQEIRPLFEATHEALWVRDVANSLAIDETEMRNLLYKAGKLGYLVPIVKDRFLLIEQITQFATLIKNFIAQHGAISVNQLRDELHYGRKLTVQLIEYFDRSGFLRRKGNVHLLRDAETF